MDYTVILAQLQGIVKERTLPTRGPVDVRNAGGVGGSKWAKARLESHFFRIGEGYFR